MHLTSNLQWNLSQVRSELVAEAAGRFEESPFPLLKMGLLRRERRQEEFLDCQFDVFMQIRYCVAGEVWLIIVLHHLPSAADSHLWMTGFGFPSGYHCSAVLVTTEKSCWDKRLEKAGLGVCHFPNFSNSFSNFSSLLLLAANRKEILGSEFLQALKMFSCPNAALSMGAFYAAAENSKVYWRVVH